uniref:Putative secreted protein n=1 Tax=Anopheles triannulatus TaxID=58253 RepID=A0A2M4B186_9DIPT
MFIFIRFVLLCFRLFLSLSLYFRPGISLSLSLSLFCSLSDVSVSRGRPVISSNRHRRASPPATYNYSQRSQRRGGCPTVEGFSGCLHISFRPFVLSLRGATLLLAESLQGGKEG